MTRQEHLLVIAAEECVEVAQRLTKASRFGLNETQPNQEFDNAYRVVQEYNDLVAVLRMLGLEVRDPEMIAAKQAKIERYLEYSKTQGTLA